MARIAATIPGSNTLEGVFNIHEDNSSDIAWFNIFDNRRTILRSGTLEFTNNYHTNNVDPLAKDIIRLNRLLHQEFCYIKSEDPNFHYSYFYLSKKIRKTIKDLQIINYEKVSLELLHDCIHYTFIKDDFLIFIDEPFDEDPDLDELIVNMFKGDDIIPGTAGNRKHILSFLQNQFAVNPTSNLELEFE